MSCEIPYNQTIWWLPFPNCKGVVDFFASVARCISKNFIKNSIASCLVAVISSNWRPPQINEQQLFSQRNRTPKNRLSRYKASGHSFKTRLVYPWGRMPATKKAWALSLLVAAFLRLAPMRNAWNADNVGEAGQGWTHFPTVSRRWWWQEWTLAETSLSFSMISARVSGLWISLTDAEPVCRPKHSTRNKSFVRPCEGTTMVTNLCGGCSDSILPRPRRAFQHELSNLQTAKLRMEPPALPAWQVRTPEHCRETEKVVRMKMPHVLCMEDGGIEIIGGWSSWF